MNQQEIDNLTPEEIGRRFPIILTKPDSNWTQLFEKEKDTLSTLLGRYAKKIEHIGSTAIPNIFAKPTIDILLEIPEDKTAKDEIIQKMKARKYYYILRTDREPPYLMFIKGISSEGITGQTYHIHMAEKGHPIWDKIYFRDYLIEKPELARQYENLKKDLAAKYRHNRDQYTEGKTDFVMQVTKEAKEKYLTSS